jgi:hypothetical protein
VRVRYSLEFAITAVILSWAIIPTIRGGWLELDSAESITNRVCRAPDENGGIVGSPYDCLLPNVEDPSEGSSLLLVVIDPSPGMSCTMHRIILDDPALCIRGSPTIERFTIEHRNEIGISIGIAACFRRCRSTTCRMSWRQYLSEREKHGKSGKCEYQDQKTFLRMLRVPFFLELE